MGSRARLRRAGLWLVTIALLAYACVDRDDEDATPDAQVDVSPDDAAKLRITDLSAAEVSPGEAIVVQIAGADDGEVTATIAKRDADVLSRRGDTIVVRVPPDVDEGRAALHIEQGDRRSKGRDLLVHPPRVHRLVRYLIGGLALILLGVRVLSGGLRQLTGPRVRELVGVWTRGRPRAVGAGVVLGGLTQLTTSSGTIAVGLVESRLITSAAAIALLAGAQLGAAITGALLPVALARESLLVIAIGMAWVLLAGERRTGGAGLALIGAGLVLYGLHLLQTGFQPLASSPELLSYLGVLGRDDLVGWIAGAALGTTLAALLQGPGPVFWLVVGLVQTTGALPLPVAMSVLAGTALGGAIATLPLALSSGGAGRRLAMPNLIVGATSTSFMLATAPLWLAIADRLVPGAPEELAYGKKVLLPHVGLHLGVAFVGAQLCATAVAAAILPWIVRRAHPAQNAPESDSAWLVDVFQRQATGLHATLELCATGERTSAEAAELAFTEARRTLETRSPRMQPLLDVSSSWQTALATLQLQRALEDLLRVADGGVALGADDLGRLRAMHELCSEGMKALTEAVRRGVSPDPEAVRAREIRLNALEADGRRKLAEPVSDDSMQMRALGPIELLDAYEGVGNRIFRVCETLDRDADLD